MTNHAQTQQPPRYRLTVCLGPRCSDRGSHELRAAFEAALERAALAGSVLLRETGDLCHHRCARGPNIFVEPGAVWYAAVQPADIPLIVQEHFLNGQPVGTLRGSEPSFLNLDTTVPWSPTPPDPEGSTERK